MSKFLPVDLCNIHCAFEILDFFFQKIDENKAECDKVKASIECEGPAKFAKIFPRFRVQYTESK